MNVRKWSVLLVAVVFAVIVSASPSQAQPTSPQEVCQNGPGTLTTGDIFEINGAPYNAVVGTAGDDVLEGADVPLLQWRDIIWGLDGDDLLAGGAGDDVLCGGLGADEMYGEDGRDALVGGLGGDLMNGGAGSDRLRGGGGDDDMDGGPGDDSRAITIPNGVPAGLWGGDGQDVMDGGDGDDWVVGQSGDDMIYGGKGEDELGGGPGFDTVNGGQNKDNCEAEIELKCEAPLFP